MRDSFMHYGVILPVVKDQYGRTLDGHQRARIAGELNIPYEVIVRPVASDEDALGEGVRGHFFPHVSTVM